MLEQLLDDLEWHGSNVCAEARRFDDMQRMTNTRRQNLRLEMIVVEDFPDLANKSHPFVSDVIQSSNKRADETRSRFRRHQGLRGIEDQRLIDANAFL